MTTGTLTLEGDILADSNFGSDSDGGGSGGAIWLDVGTLTGSGLIRANGARALNRGAGGGGSGRNGNDNDGNDGIESDAQCGGGHDGTVQMNEAAALVAAMQPMDGGTPVSHSTFRFRAQRLALAAVADAWTRNRLPALAAGGAVGRELQPPGFGSGC